MSEIGNQILGLTEAEAAERRRNGLSNRQPDSSAKSVKDIVKENILTYFNGIFLLLTVLLIAAGSFRSLTFLPVIILNTVIGIVQEIHAKKVLDELSVISEARALVLREGQEYELPIEKLVQGDVIRLRAGNQIPADARVIGGRAAVNESLLTGEADEIEKTPAPEHCELRSGSFVVSGDCYARLTRVGADSYIAQLAARAKEMPAGEQSEMIRAINRLIIVAGILIIPIGVTLFVQSYVIQESSFRDSVVSMVAAVIGMIPEGLYLLVSVALALSAVRLAQSRVVLHDMRSIETLTRVDVLCVDKTGTITSDEMFVTDCVAGEDSDPAALADYERLLGGYLDILPDNNITMAALRAFFRERSDLEVRDFLPFSSKNKYSELQARDGVYRLGAPECVLDRETLARSEEITDYYARKGERVLVFARNGDGGGRFSPLLFVALRNGLRPGVEKTFRYFRDQGVAVKVISGDNPLTVARIAQSAGVPGAERYVDCSVLAEERQLAAAARKFTVFGRVRPEQKKQLVQALQKQGHTVAMTGDGVNDILAMKEADCSIAMGSGSDAARQAAQVVLLDSDFTRMQNIVYEGRRDINNISRSATLFLVKNIFSLLLSLFSIVNLLEYPLQPTQISLVSMFNIGVPAFFLALESNQKRQKPHFLRRILLKAMPAALTDFFIIAAMVIFAQIFEVPAEDVSVAATFLLAIVGFMILIRISSPLNRFRRLVIGGCIAGMILAARLFSALFAIRYISLRCVLLFVLFAIATEPFMRYLTRFFRWLERKAYGRGGEV
ncbi:HAD-IC family P-type ATPase [Lachnoclostridium sp. Marseille-P6806]|uniref:HAD-IC family P-type ATPase n=1 Tax=Lachnoclostridium sp. Marseille-P6806 TaxID=2364793 RepID=UPI00102FC181|nr:HAD-IC family P-type ATPase [Lachnoclostridium sp. Marseille-P6806]